MCCGCRCSDCTQTSEGYLTQAARENTEEIDALMRGGAHLQVEQEAGRLFRHHVDIPVTILAGVEWFEHAEEVERLDSCSGCAGPRHWDCN